MSKQQFSEDVLFVQPLLKFDSLYQGKLDWPWIPLQRKQYQRSTYAPVQARKHCGNFGSIITKVNDNFSRLYQTAIKYDLTLALDLAKKLATHERHQY